MSWSSSQSFVQKCYTVTTNSYSQLLVQLTVLRHFLARRLFLRKQFSINQQPQSIKQKTTKDKKKKNKKFQKTTKTTTKTTTTTKLGTDAQNARYQCEVQKIFSKQIPILKTFQFQLLSPFPISIRKSKSHIQNKFLITFPIVQRDPSGEYSRPALLVLYRQGLRLHN